MQRTYAAGIGLAVFRRESREGGETENEVGGRIPGNLAIELELTARIVGAGAIHAEPPEIEAHLERVNPAGDGNVVDQLPCSAEVEVGDEAAITHGQIAGNQHRHQTRFEGGQFARLAGVGVDAANARDADRFGIEVGVCPDTTPEHPIAVYPSLNSFSIIGLNM
jgi:hypothetical protein